MSAILSHFRLRYNSLGATKRSCDLERIVCDDAQTALAFEVCKVGRAMTGTAQKIIVWVWFACLLGIASGSAGAGQDQANFARARAPDEADKAILATYINKTKGDPTAHFEFNNESAFEANWRTIEDDNKSFHSCRQKQNVNIIGNQLHLVTENANGCQSPWSTGYIKTKQRDFGYGYYLASMDFTQKTGINNAFWLLVFQDQPQVAYEIDIVEAQYPNRVKLSVHDWRAEHSYVSHAFERGKFQDNFSRYGALWLPDRIIFTTNNVPTLTVEAALTGKADIRFSTAIVDSAGKLEGDPTGATMNVEWVKYWQ